jgi:sirohydrochlorin cobaltochelatase
MNKQTIIIVGHGSKQKDADCAMRKTAEALQKKKPEATVSLAYLEIQSPDMDRACCDAIASGASEIILVPYFVQSGRHVMKHIPEIASKVRTNHPNVTIKLTQSLGFDERLVSIIEDRILNILTDFTKCDSLP